MGGDGNLNEEEMSMNVGGERGKGKLGKRCRSLSADLQQGQESEKSVFLLAYGDHDIPVLYRVVIGGRSYKMRNFCHRCCIDLVGDDKAEGKPLHAPFGLREITAPPLKESVSKSLVPNRRSMTVVLGSVVYVLGGINYKEKSSLSREVFCFDTNYPAKGWIEGPKMCCGRCNGKALAVDGKIYVFGGHDFDDAPEDPWAEVLDPAKLNEWQPLDPPPKGSDLDQNSELPAVAYGGPGEEKKIFFGSYMFVYHVNSKNCEELDSNKSSLNYLRMCGSNLAGVGNFVYWAKMGFLFAFNMKTEKLYCGQILGISEYHRDSDADELELLHFGGKEFCYLTLHRIWGGRSKVCCSKFQIFKRCSKIKSSNGEEAGVLKIKLMCRQTYFVDQSISFAHGLII